MNKQDSTQQFWVKEYYACDLDDKNLFTNQIAFVMCTKRRGKIVLNGGIYSLSSGMNFTLRSSDHLYFESFQDDIKIVIIEQSIHFYSFVHHIIDKDVLDTLFKYNTPDICSPKMLEVSNNTLTKIVNLYYRWVLN